MNRPAEPKTLLILLAPACGGDPGSGFGARNPRLEPKNPVRGRRQGLRVARSQRRFGPR